MKKNIFKFAYVALVAVAMIVIGQQEAKADANAVFECLENCQTTMNNCMNNTSWWNVVGRFICSNNMNNCCGSCSSMLYEIN